MKKVKTFSAKNGRWTEWVFPLMTNYQMACCDCGLVHNINFMAARVVKENGYKVTVEYLPKDKYQVLFKVSRNKRRTKELRKA